MLCVLPAAVLLPAFAGSADLLWKSGLSLLISCGFVFLLGRIARDAGKRLQDTLFARWGGPPTTQLLRHRDTHFDVHTKQQLHAGLAQLTGLTFPTASDEAARPADADEIYRAAVGWLLRNTRDTQRFPLVFKENIHFGFQRNALGLRWVGLAVSLLCIVGVLGKVGLLVLHPPYWQADRLAAMTWPAAACLLVSIMMALTWFFAITPDAARRTAFAYAERLLEATHVLLKDSAGA